MKKNYIKKNIIGFIVGVILCMGSLVYAAVTFPSNDVSYDNKESGLSSTTVKGAIDELYKTCTAEKIDMGGIEVPVVDEGDGLYEDPYEAGRYIYRGADPNNYITFNNEEAGWRIISKEADGTYKILRNFETEPAVRLFWDGVDNIIYKDEGYIQPTFRNDVENPYCTESDCNVWCAMDGEISNGIKSGNVKKDATGNIYLNTRYYNGLDASSKDNIVLHSWNVGPVSKNQTLEEQIEAEKSWKCNGNVGLISMSDFLLQNSNIESCSTLELLSKENAEVCADTGWMDAFRGGSLHPDNWWYTINAYVYDSEIDNTKTVGKIIGSMLSSEYTGIVDSIFGTFMLKSRPALYLNSDVKITGGDGSQNNPYTLE